MKTLAIILVLAALAPPFAAFGQSQVITVQDFMNFSVSWYGRSCLTFPLGGQFVVIDPIYIPKSYPGSGGLVLFTHDHSDHYDSQVARDFLAKGATVLAPFGIPGAKILRPGQSVKIGGLSIEAVPAYNIKKPQFHPKSKNYAGFTLKADGLSIYIAGDTERLPEMKKIKADIAFVPLGQVYTMGSVDEAAAVVLDVGAKAAAAYHYGSGAAEGNQEDAERFAALLDGKVEVWELPNLDSPQ
ncbi:MAG: MBL fold metallo-hydrolase [Spirochaetaceae bacterium]|nr:MBL fold metallo-hydrolase [Spirochaetaceae bacterium]